MYIIQLYNIYTVRYIMLCRWFTDWNIAIVPLAIIFLEVWFFFVPWRWRLRMDAEDWSLLFELRCKLDIAWLTPPCSQAKGTVLTRVPDGFSVSLNLGLRRRCIPDLHHNHHGQVWRRQFSKEFMSRASSGRRWPLQRRLNAVISPSGNGQCKHVSNPLKRPSLKALQVLSSHNNQLHLRICQGVTTMALVWHHDKLLTVFSQQSKWWFAAQEAVANGA